MIRFECPSCRKRIKTSENTAGKKGRCPKCGSPVQIPKEPSPFEPTSFPASADDSQAPSDEPIPSEYTDSPPFAPPTPTFNRVPHVEATVPTRSPARPPGHTIEFEGAFTPRITLLPDEEILDRYESNVWDLGIVGWLLGNKRRLILTTHRVFKFEKTMFENTLEVVWLQSIQSVVVGQTIRAVRLTAALLMAAGSFVFFRPEIGLIGNVSKVILWLVVFAVAALMAWTCRKKVMVLKTSAGTTGIMLTRLVPAESSRFVGHVFSILNQLRKSVDRAQGQAES